MKKSSVPLKSIARMALKNTRPVRYFFTVLLFLTALTMAGIALDIGLYSVKRVKIETYARYVSSFSVMSKKAASSGWNGEYYPLQEEELKELTKVNLPNARIGADKIIACDLLYEYGRFEGFSLSQKEHIERFAKFGCADGGYLASLEMLAGEKDLKSGDILLSACFANSYLAEGESESYEDLIGKKRSFEIGTKGAEFTIAGVYRSEECDAYKALQEGKKEFEFGECSVYNIVADEKKNSYYKPVGAAFVTQEDFENFEDGATYVCFLGDFRLETGREMETFFKEKKDTFCADMFDALDGDSEAITGLKTGFFCFALVLMGFSVLLIYQFISLSIDEERPKIALLRALGASRKSVIEIYLFKSGIMGLLSGALAAALTCTLIPAANKIFALLFGESIAVLTYHPLVFLSILLLSLLSSLLSALIPVLKGINKSPIDDMKALQN